MKRPIITLNQLIAVGACPAQCRLFKKYFGEHVYVTEKLAKQYAQEFDYSWAALHLLTFSGNRAFIKTWNSKGYWDQDGIQENLTDAINFARLYRIESNRRKITQ
jgi:hypothetical protein